MDRGAHGPQNEQVAARLRIVEEHVRLENEHNLAGIMATFADEAKYDDVPWAEQRLGRDAVEQYYRDLLAALPDLHIDVRDRLVTEDAVVLEVLISGTQVETWRGLPATRRPVRFPCASSIGSRRTASLPMRRSTTIGQGCCIKSDSTTSLSGCSGRSSLP